MSAWWGWLLVGGIAGAAVALLVAREVALYARARRGHTIDLTGARPRNRGANR